MKKNLQFLIFFLLVSSSLFSQTDIAGTWKLAPTAQALAVGPTQGDFSWWANSEADVTGRACLFDDKFVFNADGSFQNIQDGETWNEGWQGMDPEGCGASIAPHDGSNDATWTFDEMAGTITLNGVGAHLGLAKVHNGGELASPADAVASITYPVVIEGNTMTVDIDFGGIGFWHFVFEKEAEGGEGGSASPIAGTTWQIAPAAGALAVGPTLGDFSWWSNGASDVTTRACFFDDTYVFGEDGTFQNVQDGETWLEPWQGMDPEGCGASVAPHDGSTPATWVYDEAASTITLTGVGAYLGLAKVHNGGELASSADAVESITYPVVIDGDNMTIDIDFGGIGFWHFELVKVTGDAPIVEPAPEVATVNTAFGVDMNGFQDAFTTVFVSGTFNEWSGDANPLSDEDGDGIWTGTISVPEGTYEYKFTLDNWAVQEMFAGGEDCTVTAGEFTNRAIEVKEEASLCFTWNSCDACGEGVEGGGGTETGNEEPVTIAGRWKIAPIAEALAVGPALGDFSWWSNSAADVTTRACFFDDTFVFGEDGSFQNIQDGETWLEPWQGADPEACGTPVAPHDGSNAATWTFDEAAMTLTISGVGAYLGLAKVHNGGELASPADAVASITYPVVLEGNRMIIDIDFGGIGFWHFVLEKEEEIVIEPGTEEPVVGTWRIAPMAAALAVGPTMGDFSWWSNSAADVTTRACFFDDRFVFEENGEFRNEQDGETWLEPWQGTDPEACGAPVAPNDGSNVATWAFDEDAGTLTLSGVGAHLGLAKVHNGGEFTSPADVSSVASITYPVVIEGNTMTVDIDFGGIGFWHFVLEREATTSTKVEVAAENLFRFSPNPANTQIQIQSDKIMDELTIHDITGRILMQRMNPNSNETIDVSNLAKGLYIIQGRVDNKVSIEKLSIN